MAFERADTPSPRALSGYELVGGVDHTTHECRGVMATAGGEAPVLSGRRLAAPEGGRVLDQRVPSRFEHFERVVRGEFLGRDRAGGDRVVQPWGSKYARRGYVGVTLVRPAGVSGS